MQSLLRFRENQSGSTAIIFAMCVVMLTGIAGAALDFGRAMKTRASLQTALDAAILASAIRKPLDNNSGGDDDDSQSPSSVALKAYLNTNWRRPHGAGSGELTAVVTSPDATTLSGTVAVKLDTTFMKVLGRSSMDIVARSQVKFGLSNTEVALALDTTASMEGQKITDLKSAAKGFIDAAYSVSGADQKVKFAIVPFGQYVNIGTANRNASWLSVANDSTSTSNVCWDTYPNATSSNCRNETVTLYRDGVAYQQTQQVCDWNYGTAVTQCGPQTVSNTWNGCVGSRNYPTNLQSVANSSSKIPGVMNVQCGATLQRLSNVTSTLKNKIDALTPSGDTYIPSGLMWGWRALSNKAPFADGAGAVSGTRTRKILVLMTDGANTRSPNYPDHEGSDGVVANTLTAEICTNAKSDKIEIYTIAFDVIDIQAKQRLKDCATSQGYYFDAQNSSQLSDAFQTIGRNLQVTHLSK